MIALYKLALDWSLNAHILSKAVDMSAGLGFENDAMQVEPSQVIKWDMILYCVKKYSFSIII